MPRRRREQSDSLDLLLDTICNTFGGILFIAILVALLIQLKGDEETPPEEPPPRPEEIVAAQSTLEQLRNELQSVARARASQNRLIEQFAPDELQTLLKERNDRNDELLDLQDAQLSLLEANAEISAQNERDRQELSEIAAQLSDLRERVEDLESELDEDRQRRQQTVGVPVVRTNLGRREVAVILRYGRLYFWHRYDSRGYQLGLNTDDFVVLADEDGKLLTRALPTGGLRIANDDATRQLIRQRFRDYDPRQCVIAVITRSDSFAQFRIVRDVLKSMGLDYRLMPTDGPVRDRGGVGGQFQ